MELIKSIDLSGLFSQSVLSIFALFIVLMMFATLAGKSGSSAKTWRKLIDIFGNWRLVLLGLTGIVLSLASGYTTWDGMRNFTNEPILSLMITFGIQGVMLICAWLIGETFAKQATGALNVFLELAEFFRAIVFALLVGGILLGLVYGVTFLTAPDTIKSLNAYVAQIALWVGGGLAVMLLVAFILLFFQGAEIIGPYARGLRIILANLHLWVMFLACMATSVFFSFDSLFTQIFPHDERKRAADLRAINQVSGAISDIGALARKRRVEEAEALFQSKGWTDYDGQLDTLMQIARRAPDAIERHFTQKLQEKQQTIARHQQAMANSKSTQAGLSNRQTQITDELSSLKSRRPAALAEEQGQRAVVLDKEKALDTKKTEALAEEKGVEGSLKIGRGQNFRARKAEEVQIAAELEVARERYKGKKAVLDQIDKSIKTLEAELALVSGELEKLKGVASTAEQMIRVTEDQGRTESAHKFDPSGGLTQLERERLAFRQKPDWDGLQRVSTLCGTLNSAVSEVPALKEQARGIECDPGAAAEAAARLFALNVGVARYEANCASGDKLPQTGGVDALLAFAGRCVQDSGLSGKDTALLRDRINAIALSRDDKAHRFVVTWNAFNDGNRLAYLALAIALAIDGLVFMSGLFGANAIVSPLAGAPAARSRSLSSMHDIVDNALLPDSLLNAELTLNAMQPIYLERQREYTSLVDLTLFAHRAEKMRVLKVLTAGSSLGLVRPDATNPGTYLVRSDFYEYLAALRKRLYQRLDDATLHEEAVPTLVDRDHQRAAPGATGPAARALQSSPGPRLNAPAAGILPRPALPPRGHDALDRFAEPPQPGPRSLAGFDVQSAFLDALRVGPHDDAALRSEEFAEAIAAAVDELGRACHYDEALHGRVVELEQLLSQEISATLEQLSQRLPAQSAALRDEAQDCKHLIRPSLLVKDGCFDQIVRQLIEQASSETEGRDDELSHENAARKRAYVLYLKASRENARRSPRDWHQHAEATRELASSLAKAQAIAGRGSSGSVAYRGDPGHS